MVEDPPGVYRTFNIVSSSFTGGCNSLILLRLGDSASVMFTSVRWFVKKSGGYFKID